MQTALQRLLQATSIATCDNFWDGEFLSIVHLRLRGMGYPASGCGIYPPKLTMLHLCFAIHICIGASERILDHCLSRSSAPTIPVSCQ